MEYLSPSPSFHTRLWRMPPPPPQSPLTPGELTLEATLLVVWTTLYCGEGGFTVFSFTPTPENPQAH